MDLDKFTNSLKDKYKDVGIEKIEVNDEEGKATFYLNPTNKALAFLDKTGVVPRQFKDKAATITRDAMSRTTLDLQLKTSPYDQDPKDLYEQAIKYYYNDPLVGSATNVLANLSAKGFEHDIDDPKIKAFYDYWALDTNFYEVLEWIFLDFFKVGQVYTYKVISKYEPRVSTLSPIPGQAPKKKAQGVTEEKAAKSRRCTGMFRPD